MKIAIVTDKSRENLISLEEAQLEDKQKLETVRSIKRILSQKYDCLEFTADENIIKNLKEENIDLVFNLCNGIEGFSRLAQLPAMLEFANIPYTGSSILGHALAINKVFASTVFKSNNIPTPDFISVNSMKDIEDIQMDYPILIKPSDEGSSRGIHQDSLVFDYEQLKKKMEYSLDMYNPPIMLNQYIVGREFSIGVVGNGDDVTILPIQEVDMSELPDGLLKFNSFEVKSYYKSHVNYYLPGRISEEEKVLIEDAVLKAYKSLLLRDYARVDIRLKNGDPYVIEVNSLPGLERNHSDICKMAKSINIEYDDLIKKIVKHARDRIK